MYTVEIDGKTLRVPPGTTVLEAAQQLDIDIPTLCHHQALSPQGACRVCVVEMSVEKRGRTYNWVDAACVYPVEDGLKIATDTPKVQRERKLILELLLSKAPDSPVLNAMAERYGVNKAAFEALDHGTSNCILCSLCVRTCNEIIKANAIGTAHRGVEKQVTTPYKIASSRCIGCRACEYMCPTGVISIALEEAGMKIGNWDVELEMESCASCGKPVAPKVYTNQLQQQVSVQTGILHKCPECRRKEVRVA